jgi:hypothetical protein
MMPEVLDARPRPKVSFGNKKLPKDTLIFNIPARITCPGRTALCGGACYALKAERLYKAVLPARQWNFEITRQPDFVGRMGKEIERHAHKIKRVRIHESGDFYNQAYLEHWFSVATAFPSLRFYAYTKSFHLDFSRRPVNFWLIASFDATTTTAQREAYQRQRLFFQNSFTIVDRHAPASCIQDCTTCDACWTGKGRALTVNQH